MGRKRRVPEKMTVEKLRTYPGCENLTDEQASEILFSFERLAEVLFTSFKKDKIKSDDSDNR